jgi:hypothetical protein
MPAEACISRRAPWSAFPYFVPTVTAANSSRVARPISAHLTHDLLWHGNVYKALQVVQAVEMDLDAAVATSGNDTARKLLKAVEEFHTYIENNQGFIPNYGERYHNGERISTGFVESTVNQVISKRFCKKQQMQWTKRATHLLLQTRVKTLNHELRAVFRRWYPDFPVEEEEALQAA